MDHKKTLAVPDWVRIDSVKSEQSTIVPETMEYFRINQIAPTGLPLAIASGKGDATNRSTLLIHLRMLQDNLKEIVKKTISTFERFILQRIADSNEVSEIAHIEWGPIGFGEIELIVKYIIDAAKEEIITKDEARKILIESLSLNLGKPPKK